MRFSPHTEDWKLDSTHFPRVKPFDLFWTRLVKTKSEVDGVAHPQLPRKQRAPARTEAGDRVCPFCTHDGSDISARHALFSNLCDAIECIRTRFNKKDFKVYENIQEILLKTKAGKDHEELTKVTAIYGGTDLQRYKLEPQLSLLPDMVQSVNGVRHLIWHSWSPGLFSITRKCSQSPTLWDLHSW